MTFKYCNKCNLTKPISYFYKGKNSCAACISEAHKNYFRTKEGLISKIYTNQVTHSRERGHLLPIYTLSELKEWFSLQENFDDLYNNWVLSGYSKNIKPSCDRLDDYKSYSFSNIRLVTWQINHEKGISDRMSGANKKQLKAVNQISLSGLFLSSYYSAAKASRSTGIIVSSITKCCRGVQQTAGGFMWRYPE